MFIWCGILFLLGLMAFLDAIFNMGELFRGVNSVFFMLISLGLLFRTTSKIKDGRIEEYEKRIFALEQQVNILRQGKEKLDTF